ncbi:MAG: homocysteine S-methyltransferase family protein [Gammaproteobacteria bacterium]|nr:homocysteine S-methyltransferase family protein [Gammaproteobacteria bacterium]
MSFFTAGRWRSWLELHRDRGLKILGGCCGTDRRHLKYIVEHKTG